MIPPKAWIAAGVETVNTPVDTVDALVQRIRIQQSGLLPGQRLLVAIAGAPGAGKSTLAARLCQELNLELNPELRLRGDEQAIVVPMDGFHLDDAILNERGWRAVKGAPHTFDVDGFVTLVRRLAEPGDAPVYIPVFDRRIELSRNAAACVQPHHTVILLEGNYLLLDRPGWQDLTGIFHISIMLDVPLETLEARLVQRWLDNGLDPAQARIRALGNDIPNARIVLQESIDAHLCFKGMRQ